MEAVSKENQETRERMLGLKLDKPTLESNLVNIEKDMKKLVQDQEKVQREKENFSKKNEIVNVKNLIEIKNKEDFLKKDIQNEKRKILIAIMMAKRERKAIRDKGLKMDMDLEEILAINTDLKLDEWYREEDKLR